jgi:hypothetical protein
MSAMITSTEQGLSISPESDKVHDALNTIGESTVAYM